MTTIDNENCAKMCKKFECQICDYFTSRKSCFIKHNESKKHKNKVLTTIDNENCAKLCKPKYTCEFCAKGFNDRAGLWRHNKKCNVVQNIGEISSDLIIDILKQNSMFQQTIIEQNKTIMELAKSAGNNNNNVTNNSHNKTFNLQFFLNETCKDAMNIMDFVDSIKLQLSDLESVGKLGYVEGISHIITKNLNALDVTQRPVHCTDKKREVLYIKDEDKWEKEDAEKQKMRKVIRKVASKNQRLLPEFKKAHPDCTQYHSTYSDQYNKIIVESMGGSGDNDTEKEDKIIRNISKVTSIEGLRQSNSL